MKTILLFVSTFAGGMFFGFYWGSVASEDYNTSIRYVNIEGPIRDGLIEMGGGDIPKHGLEIIVSDWLLHVIEGSEKHFLLGSAGTREFPIVTMGKGLNNELRLVAAEDRSERIVAIDVDGGEEFRGYTVWVERDDGSKHALMDEEFTGFFTRAAIMGERGAFLGNFSKEEWLPLTQIDGRLMAIRDGTLVPVKEKDGRLVFVERPDVRDGKSNAGTRED